MDEPAIACWNVTDGIESEDEADCRIRNWSCYL
jgi:hypothetical protein